MSEQLALPDVNVLVALTNASHTHHAEAHRWLASIRRFATTPITEAGLLRMLLNPLIAGRHVAMTDALEILRRLRGDERARFITDDSSLTETALDLTGILGYRQVADWHLLNLAVRNDAQLVTFDRRMAASVLPRDAVSLVVLS